MNCKHGDYAFVRTTHPDKLMWGKLVKCCTYHANASGKHVWICDMLRQPDTHNGIIQLGRFEDRHLFAVGQREEVLREKAQRNA